MLVTAILLPGLKIDGPLAALSMVIALAFVNTHIWDAALFVHIPDSITSQAVVLFLSNGAIFWVLVKLLPGVSSKGLVPVLLAPVIFSLTSILITRYSGEVDWLKIGKSLLEVIESVRNYLQASDTIPTEPRSP